MIADDCIEKIVGEPTPGPWHAAVVMQGPYIRNHTRTCIEEWLTRNPRILIIVSTYLPTDAQAGGFDFLSPYERARIAEGVLIFIFVKQPSCTGWPDFWRTNQANQNLQRLTSFVGLRYAHQLDIEFSLKVRADTFLGRPGIINHMKTQVQSEYPLSTAHGRCRMKGRLAVTGHCTVSEEGLLPHAPFHVRDHFYFGYTTDVMRFFDLRDQLWDNGTGIQKTAPESAMTVLWMKSMGIEVRDVKELLGRCFIVEDTGFVEQVRLEPKGPNGVWWSMNYSRYLREGAAYLKSVYASSDNPRLVTTHAQWKQFVLDCSAHVEPTRRC